MADFHDKDIQQLHSHTSLFLTSTVRLFNPLPSSGSTLRQLQRYSYSRVYLLHSQDGPQQINLATMTAALSNKTGIISRVRMSCSSKGHQVPFRLENCHPASRLESYTCCVVLCLNKVGHLPINRQIGMSCFRSAIDDLILQLAFPSPHGFSVLHIETLVKKAHAGVYGHNKPVTPSRATYRTGRAFGQVS